MLKKLILNIIGCLILMNSYGHAPDGGLVTYRYLSGSKFEIKYKVYDYCVGIPLSMPDYTIRCASSGTTKNLTATRISIVNILPYCDTTKKTCSSGNNYLEEHTYVDTLDFDGSESSFKSCCIIQIGVGQCCRPASITTGASGANFWVFSTLDLCKAATNTSPVFTFKPTFIVNVNQAMMISFLAKDTIDNDSLSYSFTDPMQNFISKTFWSGSGIDSKNPFTPYYPINYNKALGPKPYNNPPYGTYLDPQTGNLIAMPTNPNEKTIMAISVKEWRKDGNGNYVQIGEIVLDQSLYFINQTNHQPMINQTINHKVCEGQKYSIDIPTDDQPFTQPPPAPNLRNDTVTLSWDKGIKGATYTIANPNVKLPVGKFEWTPATGDSKKPPFSFSAIAIDNNCPLRAMTIKTFKFTVYPKINVTTTVKKLNNYTYTAGINISNKKYNYVSGKTVSSAVIADIRNYYFKSSNTVYSTSEIDTLVFKKNGTYILSQSFISETECNSTTINDTIVINGILEVTFGMDSSGTVYTDTGVCKNQEARMVARVSNATRPVTYTWNTKTKTQTDTLGYFDQAFNITDTLYVKVKDASGQTNSTFRTVNVLELPKIYAGPDIISCPESIIKLKAKNNMPGQTTWIWYKNLNAIGTADTLITTMQGEYIVSGTNVYGCTLNDSIIVNHYTPDKIKLISGLYCQDKNELLQSEILQNPNPDLLFDKITWKLLKSLPTTAGGQTTLGDILIDNDPTADYDYVMGFDATKINMPTNRDSLILMASAIDTNGCLSADTMTVALLKRPTLIINKKFLDNCINETIELDSVGASVFPKKWIPFYRDGFSNWPSYAPLASSVIASKYFPGSGKYKLRLEANNEFCTATDSTVINVLPLPKPIIGLVKYTNSIRFRDETVNEKSHKWYINNVFYSSDDTMLLSKTFVHLQPIKLEVIDNSGCMKDTTIIINTLIGIEAIIKSNIEIYPNPANTTLILKQTNNWVPSQYEIYDVLGNKVIYGRTKSREESIDLKNIRSGLYYLKYLSDEGIISVPFNKID